MNRTDQIDYLNWQRVVCEQGNAGILNYEFVDLNLVQVSSKTEASIDQAVKQILSDNAQEYSLLLEAGDKLTITCDIFTIGGAILYFKDDEIEIREIEYWDKGTGTHYEKEVVAIKLVLAYGVIYLPTTFKELRHLKS